MAKSRILIADDHQVVIGGIRSSLSEFPEFEIVGEAYNGRDAVRLAGSLKPDIVIMDISMPDLNGIDATLQLRKQHPDVRIIVFSMHSDKEYIVDLLKAGISGYVLKEDSMTDLVLAIQTAQRGGMYLSMMVPKTVMDQVWGSSDREGAREGFENLSLREREVLQLLAEGNNIVDIAAKLRVSRKTVETHKSSIMEKLGVRTVADLTRICIRKKLILP